MIGRCKTGFSASIAFPADYFTEPYYFVRFPGVWQGSKMIVAAAPSIKAKFVFLLCEKE